MIGEQKDRKAELKLGPSRQRRQSLRKDIEG